MKIIVQIGVFDQELDSLGIEDVRIVDMILETDHISAARPAIFEREVSDTETCLYMVSGETFVVNTPMSHFQKILLDNEN